MRAKRYLKDYKLEPRLNEKGGLSHKASYVGAYHRFSLDRASLTRLKRSYLLLTLLSLLLLVPQLWFTDLLNRDRRFLILPMSFNVFPAFGVVMSVLRLHMVGERMTNRQRDLICNRLPMFSFLFFFFAVLSFLCMLAELSLGGLSTVSLLYSVAALALLLVSFRMFTLRKKITTELITD